MEDLGFVAPLAAGGDRPQPGDLVIKGEFLTVDAGSRLKRMVIGFGAGAAELVTHVEAFYKTKMGLQRLGSADVEAEGGKMPGMAPPIGVGAAAGNVVVSAAVSGGMSAAKEVGPESLQGAVKRSADQTAKLLSQRFHERGWIPAKKVRH
jgi:hypothetical protein